jgi:hypothetical protein
MARSSGARLGACEVLAANGAGATGDVHQAGETRVDRTVAISVPPLEASANPVPSTASGQSTVYLVMQGLAGETLAARLEKRRIRFETMGRVFAWRPLSV